MLHASIADGTATALLAYLDPGSGSMQLQMLLAGLLSGAYFVKAYCSQARDLFRRRFCKGA